MKESFENALLSCDAACFHATPRLFHSFDAIAGIVLELMDGPFRPLDHRKPRRTLTIVKQVRGMVVAALGNAFRTRILTVTDFNSTHR